MSLPAYHDGVLAAIGLTETEEAVYMCIIDRPGQTLQQVAESTALTQRDARQALRALEQTGLVTVVLGTPQRFAAAPPDVAVEALVRQRLAELQQVRTTANQLAERVRTSNRSASPLEVVEVISGLAAMTRRLDQLQRQAEHEICVLDRPPYARVRNTVGLERAAAGVRFRTIYDQEALALPGGTERLEEFVQAGEEARVIVGLPTKLGLFDARVAFLPLYPVITGGLVIHHSPLVDALVMLFEELWERAVPLGPATGSAPPDAGLTERERELLKLLAAGQKDEAIARRLGVTTRTVQRLISDLMKRLKVSTRYQAGLQAARKGWH